MQPFACLISETTKLIWRNLVLGSYKVKVVLIHISSIYALIYRKLKSYFINFHISISLYKIYVSLRFMTLNLIC